MEQVGFIGLGIMGLPMARNLAKAGFPLVVHNRSRESVDTLLAEFPDQVIAAGSPAEVGSQASLVITMLPDSPDVKQVVFGEAGLLDVAGPGFLLIDMSTIAPTTAIEVSDALREKEASALDAPVSGGDKGAIAGTLSIMVGGAEADLERARPVFEAMGQTIVHVGGPGAGQIVKVCNQIAVSLHYAAASEALVLGAKAGVDPEKIIQVLNGGLAASRVLELRGPTMAKHEFPLGFPIRLHQKDLGIILDTSKAYAVPLPVTAVVNQLYASVAANGGAQLDHSGVITAIETLAGYQIGENGETH